MGGFVNSSIASLLIGDRLAKRYGRWEGEENGEH